MCITSRPGRHTAAGRRQDSHMTPSCTKKLLKPRCPCPSSGPNKQRGFPCEGTEGAATPAVGHAVPQGGGQGLLCNALRMGTQADYTGLLPCVQC